MAVADPLATDLATSATQRTALERLRDQPTPATKQLLQALKEGALYTWRGKLYRFSDAGTFVDMAGKALLDSAGEPLFPEDGMEEVLLEEANIPLVQRVLDGIDLFGDDPARRKSIALRLGNLKDASLLSMLDKAFQQERDPGVQAVLTAAINKLRLVSPEANVRLEAVRHLGATRAEAALS